MPWLATDGVPSYAFPVIVIFGFFIIGNLIAIPFEYVFASSRG